MRQIRCFFGLIVLTIGCAKSAGSDWYQPPAILTPKSSASPALFIDQAVCYMADGILVIKGISESNVLKLCLKMDTLSNPQNSLKRWSGVYLIYGLSGELLGSIGSECVHLTLRIGPDVAHENSVFGKVFNDDRQGLNVDDMTPGFRGL